MNAPKTDKPPLTEPAPLPAPENETYLTGIAMPLGEAVVQMTLGGQPAYGILQRSRAFTEQSDFFRVQFRGYARQADGRWLPMEGDDAQLHNTYNCAWVRLDHPSRTALFGPKGGIQLTPAFAGSGLDTFLFAQVILWAKGVRPDYSVSPGLVSMPSTTTEDERPQRNAFYASQGFQFDWQDSTQKTALYFKEKVGKLLGVWDAQAIRPFNGEDMLRMLAEQDTDRYDLELRLHQLQHRQQSLQMALQKERTTAQILMGVTVAALLFGLWAVL